MWLFFNDAYFSIVHKDCEPHEVIVRARRKGDIEKYWPYARVTSVDHADYQYRATLARNDVWSTIADAVELIDYPSFKDSVKDVALHRIYSRVWSAAGGWARFMQPRVQR